MAEILEINEEHHTDVLTRPDNGEGGEKTVMNISYGKTMMWYFCCQMHLRFQHS